MSELPTNLTTEQKDYAIFLPAISSFYSTFIGKQRYNEYVEYDRGGGSPDAELNRLSFHKFLPMSVEEFAQCIKQE